MGRRPVAEDPAPVEFVVDIDHGAVEPGTAAATPATDPLADRTLDGPVSVALGAAVTPRSSRLVALGIGLLLLCGLAAIMVPAGGRGADRSGAPLPGQGRPATTASAARPAVEAADGATDRAGAPAVGTSLGGTSAFGTPTPPLFLVATTDVGTPPFWLNVSGLSGTYRHGPLDGLRAFGIDRGGSLLAAVGDNGWAPAETALVVGPLGGELQRLAVGVRGYAWHDTRPQTLAFIARTPPDPGDTGPDGDADGGGIGRGGGPDGDAPGEGGARLFTVELGGERPTATPLVSAELVSSDWLLAWGDWGFVVGPAERASSFRLLDAEGRPVSERRPGVAVVHVDGLGIVTNPVGGGTPMAIEPATGAETPIRALAGTRVVRAAAGVGRNGAMAYQVTTVGDRKHAVVIVEADQVVARLPVGGTPVAMVWTDGGERLAYVFEDERADTQLVLYDLVAGREARYPISILDPVDHRVEALVVDPPIDPTASR